MGQKQNHRWSHMMSQHRCPIHSTGWAGKDTEKDPNFVILVE